MGSPVIEQTAGGRSTARANLSSHTVRNRLSVKSVPDQPILIEIVSRTSTLPNLLLSISKPLPAGIYSYLAFSAARYPQSIVEITGLSVPTW